MEQRISILQHSAQHKYLIICPRIEPKSHN